MAIAACMHRMGYTTLRSFGVSAGEDAYDVLVVGAGVVGAAFAVKLGTFECTLQPAKHTVRSFFACLQPNLPICAMPALLFSRLSLQFR